MQSSICECQSQSAYSPSHKKQCFSGYPSPPSSGRNDREEENHRVEYNEGGRKGLLCDESRADQQGRQSIASKDAVDVERRSIGEWNDSSDGDEEERSGGFSESEDEALLDDAGNVTITAVSRSASLVSSTATIRSSGPPRASSLQRLRDEGSPYVHSKILKGPIRDTPRNPFLEGGPADVGHAGPYGRTRQAYLPNHSQERGKMTYVFRGQRVTYADPYASDSDDDGGGPSTRGCMMDRLQPKLLFPSIGKPNLRPLPMQVAKVAPTAKPNMIKRRPTLDMTMGYQGGCVEKQTRVTTQQHLLDRIEQAGWSDDDDEHTSSHPCNEQGVHFDQRRILLEEAENDDEEMKEQEENPFMSFKTAMQGNAAFVNRLFQAQASNTINTRGVMRSNHGNHRFNPYSKQ